MLNLFRKKSVKQRENYLKIKVNEAGTIIVSSHFGKKIDPELFALMIWHLCEGNVHDYICESVRMCGDRIKHPEISSFILSSLDELEDPDRPIVKPTEVMAI